MSCFTCTCGYTCSPRWMEEDHRRTCGATPPSPKRPEITVEMRMEELREQVKAAKETADYWHSAWVRAQQSDGALADARRERDEFKRLTHDALDAVGVETHPPDLHGHRMVDRIYVLGRARDEAYEKLTQSVREHYPPAFRIIVADRDRLQQQLAESRAALAKYGRHERWCLRVQRGEHVPISQGGPPLPDVPAGERSRPVPTRPLASRRSPEPRMSPRALRIERYLKLAVVLAALVALVVWRVA